MKYSPFFLEVKWLKYLQNHIQVLTVSLVNTFKTSFSAFYFLLNAVNKCQAFHQRCEIPAHNKTFSGEICVVCLIYMSREF